MSTDITQVPRTNVPALPWRAWIVLLIVLIADVMDMLDSTITNLAAPSILRDIGGGELLVKWLGASYALAMGIALVVGGRLGDKYGQRRMFLVGMFGFTLASLMCGLSNSPGMMIAARVLQGGFGALMIPQGFGMIAQTFPREHMGKAFSAFGPVMGLSMVGGPILAGFMIGANWGGLGWRPMFLINLILGTVGLLAALRFLPRAEGARDTVVDASGATLLAGAMFSLLFGLTEGSTAGWTLRTVAMIVAGLGLFGVFCWRQSVAEHPLLEPTLLRNRGFTSGLIVGLCFFASVSGLAYVISLFLQNSMGLIPVGAAIAMAPVSLGICLAAIAGAPLIAKLGRTLIFAGLLISLGGAAWLLVMINAHGIHVPSAPLAGVLLVMGVGMGTCFGTLFDVALGDTEPHQAGSASGALNAIQQLAAGTGSAMVTTVYFSALARGGVPAMAASLQVVCAAMLLCCGLVWLMPRRAAETNHGH